ncbi:hypothetical protein KKF84_19975 [Myxococcota bacterium]|nr:hypothetical protein [Myxococcota bacterium]
MKYFILALLFVACQGKGDKSPAPEKETIAPVAKALPGEMGKKPAGTPTKIVKPSPKAVAADFVSADTMAQIYSGVTKGLDPKKFPILKHHAWKEYSIRTKAAWKKYMKKREGTLRKWSSEHLKGPQKEGKTIFYPFSGADIVYPELFFPWSNDVVMMGLEPAGSLMDLRRASEEDVIAYTRQIENTVEHIIHLTFFRTRTMRKQMFHKNVQNIDGTLPTLLFFLKHLGNTIEKVERVQLAADGTVTSLGEDSALRLPAKINRVPKKGYGKNARHTKPMKIVKVMDPSPSQDPVKNTRKVRKKGKRIKKHKVVIKEAPVYEVIGNRISYVRPDGSKGRVTYFSVNLSDYDYRERAGFTRMVALNAFLKKLSVGTTYLKSASYLMHKSFFSAIRGIVLKSSAYLLQDDSGIPLKYFLDEWDNHFFGRYTQPIKLFKLSYQAGLYAIYNAKKAPPKLPFGIGYSIYSSRSNLHLARKMSDDEVKKNAKKIADLKEFIEKAKADAKAAMKGPPLDPVAPAGPATMGAPLTAGTPMKPAAAPTKAPAAKKLPK